MIARKLLFALSPFAATLASCGNAATGEKGAGEKAADPSLSVETLAQFDEPWAMAFDPGTGTLFVTERPGKLRLRTPEGKLGEVSGVPKVAYGGQGGLGDIAFAPGQTGTKLDRRVLYLSWAEQGTGDTRGAAVGKADLVCSPALACRLEGLKVIWRQDPKVSGQGHYSHRLAFSPDGKYLFVASGERQKFTPAQDLGSNLGKVVRLLPDGTPAPGNPFAEKGAPGNQIWSYGHRNILGLAFDRQGRLWDLEHGPKGGDELNLVEPGKNYGWPLVSDGDHYDGRAIPRNATRPDLAQPAISWNPVIAPGDFIFYTGSLFAAWKDQAIIAGMVYPGLVRVKIDGAKATEEQRYPLPKRIREIRQGPDGALWLLEDGKEDNSGHLLRITPGKTAN
ncbi:PQQ-dependent sugar dehydrogenase [Novosphingobium sp. Rr 2-17]|uniref:PQQ-dependent sugar dehydrogenase n=1 Tax=Novosphingobium sp. Rr 2-17 TaxID=555793 RepID=UPI0005BB9B70|nr:PQQ-dependent sugar dehydrogenase [Novosphingobium sp. Rr 2-17]